MATSLDELSLDGIPIIEYSKEECLRTHHEPRERPLSSKTYQDLHSIDWIHEYERYQFSSELGDQQQPRWQIWIRQWSRWLILVATGLSIGGSTALLDYSYKWLSDFKRGYCSRNVLHGYMKCCAGQTAEECVDWRSWGDVIGLHGVGSALYKYILFSIISLILAFIAAVIVKDTKYVRNSGISEVKAVINGLVLKNLLSFKLLVIKWIGLLLMVSSGAWIGKEGPLVHIACASSAVIMKFFPIWNHNEAKKREILVAASAAGIAVAFNTPIGGVIFTLEQLTSYFNPSDKMWTSFVCSMVGIVVLNVFKDGIDAYVTMNNQWLSVELLGFVLLGILGGFYGYLFNGLNLKFANLREKYITPKGVKFEVLEILVLSIVTSIVTYPLVLPRLPLTSLIGVLYRDCNKENLSETAGLCEAGSNPVTILIFTGIVGTILTAYTFGTIIPSGILMPSLVVGGIVGRLLGILMEFIQHKSEYLTELCDNSKQLCISPGAYAVVGSASFLTGVTKMTVWVVVTVFEMTGALTYVLPIMITVLISRLISDCFTEYNCYDLWIKFLNYPFLHEINRVLPLVRVDKFIKHLHDDNLKVIYMEDQILKLRDMETFLQYDYQGLPMLKSQRNPVLIGWLPLDDLRERMELLKTTTDYDSTKNVAFMQPHLLDDQTVDFTALMERNYLSFSPYLELPTLIETVFKLKPRLVLFVEEGKFKGLLTLKDVTRIAQSSKNELLRDNY